MKIFDTSVDASFKTLDDGTILVYPWGIFGKGYVVPSLEKKEQMRNEFKRRNRLMVPWVGLYFVIGIIALVGRYWYGLILCAFIFIGIAVWSFITSARYTKGLEVTPIRISAGEIYEKAAKSWNSGLLWIVEILSWLFVLAGIWSVYEGSVGVLTGLASIVFFGFCGLSYGYMLYAKFKKW